ncbi:rhodopsin-like isoform X1 [Anticarsia gemmatalis]|uniref:rhodopsin-like isoform X1 n=1 Tax=Anticarsia gemmatalis TaxID=129554 RepID=UPI003F75C3B3
MKLERYIENNFSDVCVWNDIFSHDERIILQEGFLLTGLLSVMFSAWLSVTLLFTSLRFDSSYRNLANFTSVACVRRVVPALLHLPLVKCIETLYGFQSFSCELFAFLETFLAVFEVECLTHVCIERYVLAKYITNGWQIRKNHYYLYFGLCVFFSWLYSIPPLIGIGRYGFDFQCTCCTFDVILPDNWQRYIVVAIFALRSIKPAIFMTMTLIWARVLESKFPSSMKDHQQFTRSVIVMTLVSLFCWTPIAMIRGSVLLSQLMHVDLMFVTSFYIMWAMWLHWIAPTFTVIALFLVDDRVRYKMFNLCAPEHEQLDNEGTKED